MLNKIKKFLLGKENTVVINRSDITVSLTSPRSEKELKEIAEKLIEKLEKL